MKQHLNPWEFPEELHKYEYSVLELCELLHMSKTGSGDTIHGKGLGTACKAIVERLAEWEPSKVPATRYDEAVRELLRATLAEQN